MSERYVDFSVGIESAAGGGYRVRAFSPQAEAESLTRFDFDVDRLNEGLRSRMSSVRPGSRVRDLAGSPGDPSMALDLEEAGRTLFAALFTGEVGELYGIAWSAAQAAGHGLRIRLHLRPRSSELAWLTRIPWEILFDERAGVFPGLNSLNPLIRHLDLPRPVERVSFQLPLRVLVVAANPAGLSALDLKGEQEAIEASRQVRVKVLEGPGPEDLWRELQGGQYQVIHFMGHGLSDSAHGSLVFSTPEGQPRLVTGSELSHLVQGASSLGLTLLNACHSAAVPKGSGADPLAGVAAALVRGGQSAVVGMQLAIPDRAALTFSKALYSRLAEGVPIEAAVSGARLALYLADSGASDWVAPVLFLRGSDQRIEEGGMKENRPKRDMTEVLFKSDGVQGREMDITGAFLSGQPQERFEGRALDTRTQVEIGQVKVEKISITGSDHRSSK
jgi:hypothetical protein